MNSNIEVLTEGIKDYLSTNSELLKLEATQESSEVVSVMISRMIIGMLGMFFLFFLSLFAGFYFSSLLGSNFEGFAIVAGFYLLLTTVVFLARTQLLAQPICNMLIKMILQKTQ